MISLNDKMSNLEDQIDKLKRQQDNVNSDQARIRSNLQAVTSHSDHEGTLRKRYVDQLTREEDTLVEGWLLPIFRLFFRNPFVCSEKQDQATGFAGKLTCAWIEEPGFRVELWDHTLQMRSEKNNGESLDHRLASSSAFTKIGNKSKQPQLEVVTLSTIMLVTPCVVGAARSKLFFRNNQRAHFCVPQQQSRFPIKRRQSN